MTQEDMVSNTTLRVLNRELQRRYLEVLSESYPDMVDVQRWDPDPKTVTQTLHYLSDHELVDVMTSKTLGSDKQVIMARITARGLDFIADDGGLSAVLGIVTVQLHADTLRALIETKIAASTLPGDEKKSLLTHVKALPAEALKELTKRLVGLGLEATPDVVQQLRIWLDSLRS